MLEVASENPEEPQDGSSKGSRGESSVPAQIPSPTCIMTFRNAGQLPQQPEIPAECRQAGFIFLVAFRVEKLDVLGTGFALLCCRIQASVLRDSLAAVGQNLVGLV